MAEAKGVAPSMDPKQGQENLADGLRLKGWPDRRSWGRRPATQGQIELRTGSFAEGGHAARRWRRDRVVGTPVQVDQQPKQTFQGRLIRPVRFPPGLTVFVRPPPTFHGGGSRNVQLVE